MVFASKLDRRVTIQRKDKTRGAANEQQIAYVTVKTRVPAGKVAKPSSAGEDLEMGKALRAEVHQEWEIRFYKDMIPQANWRLIDEYNMIHEIIAPPTEIGRRVGWLLKTKQVQ